VLLGRDHERREIEQALARSRSGASAVLALVGEPGIGKTALLDYAASRAEGMQLLRARGIESEAQIPFGSLLELIRPALVSSTRSRSPRPWRSRVRWPCGLGRRRTVSRSAPRHSACSLPTPSRLRWRCSSTTLSGWTDRARRRCCSPSAGGADPEQAVVMLAEAASACLYAGNPAEMLPVAERAWAGLAAGPSVRARFLAGMALGMARIFGGHAAVILETDVRCARCGYRRYCVWRFSSRPSVPAGSCPGR
jgi:hypothetical protein